MKRAGGELDELVTLRELAARLHVCYQTARRLARERAFPAFKIGRVWRFSWPQVLKALEAASTARKLATETALGRTKGRGPAS